MSTCSHKISMATGKGTSGRTCTEVVQHHIAHSVNRPCWLVGVVVPDRGLVHQPLSLLKLDLTGNTHLERGFISSLVVPSLTGEYLNLVEHKSSLRFESLTSKKWSSR